MQLSTVIDCWHHHGGREGEAGRVTLRSGDNHLGSPSSPARAPTRNWASNRVKRATALVRS
jgi:hypothetical protein